MKYSEFDLEGMHEIKKDVHQRWEQLNTLVVDTADRASKQLFVTNGAGAIALMSYFGVAEKGRFFFGMKVSLCLFVLGVILAMVVTAFLYHGYSHILEGWRQDSKTFYKSEMNYNVLWSNDETRFKEGRTENAATITSYLSFGCFISGCLSTLAAVICQST